MSNLPLRQALRPPATPLPQQSRIYVHEDKLPTVPVIPFKLDDLDDKPSAEDGKANQNSITTKLRLPPAHGLSRKQFEPQLRIFRGRRSFRPLKKIYSTDDLTNNDVPETNDVQFIPPKLTNIELMNRMAKKKLASYLIGKEVTFSIDGIVTRLLPSQRKDIPNETEGPDISLVKIFDIVNSIRSTLNFSKLERDIPKVWKKHKVSVSTKQATKLIGIKLKEFMNLDILDTLGMPKNFIKNSSAAIVPDIMKMLALTAWQKSDLQTCLFLLNESHNFFMKREIINRHAEHFWPKTSFITKTETVLHDKTEDLITLQYDEMCSFASTPTVFMNDLNKLNPNWNIVQLSNLFYHGNRFGSSVVKEGETPAIFISSFVHFNGKRYPSVTYQSSPSDASGVPVGSIIERLKILMTMNRHIHDKFNGSRQKYWKARGLHNKELEKLIGFVEESWIFPWEFLFPGNIADESVANSIATVLHQFEHSSAKPLPVFARGVLYKLIENYNMLKSCVTSRLSTLIALILGVREEVVEEFSRAVTKCGMGIDIRSGRFPTILILDRELDLIPWECMNCLLQTPVTRVPSLSMINCLSVLKDIKREKYSEIVDPSNCAYILNPDGTLEGVESRLSGYFGEAAKWIGLKGCKPKFEDIESYYQTKDIYLYCGHGSGVYYLPEHRIQRLICRAIPLLMGCGSVRYKHYFPRSYSTSIMNFLFPSTCLSAVGFLYEVTDLECDRVTIELLERWAPGAKEKLPDIWCFDTMSTRTRVKCLASAVALSRKAPTQYLTSAAIVHYGIPITTFD